MFFITILYTINVEYSKITNSQEFMNQASLKFYNICNTGTGFQGSFQTIIKDVVAVMAEKKQKRKPVANLSTSDKSEPDTKK